MRFVLAVIFLTATACATTTTPADRLPDGLAPGVYDVASGQILTEQQFDAAIVSAQFVVVGESHDSEEDHALQMVVFRKLTSRKRAALGMEMFQRPFQPHLDAFVAGSLSESEMLLRTEWESRWGFDAAFYRPLWTHAKELGYAIIALNVQRELTKRVSAVGYEGLSDEERVHVVEVDLTRDDYRAWLRDVFAGHGMNVEGEKFERFYQAQVLWDETMAESAVRFLENQPSYEAVFLAVGRGHVEHRWGIPSRIERRLPESKVLVIVRSDRSVSLEEAKKGQLADILVVP